MIMQLQGVGKQKISYKDPGAIHFDNLDDYLLLAKKAIAKFSNSICSGISPKMLKDEEAISAIANALMMADWRWDSDYQSATGTKKTRYSYRNQCAIWAIQTYITKNFTKSKYISRSYSLDDIYSGDNTDSNRYSFIEDCNSPSPEDILIKKEETENLKSLVDQLLSLECLSAKQKDYIKLYYFENYTFEKIGKKYNVTREAVRQSLNKALDTIRSSINE